MKHLVISLFFISTLLSAGTVYKYTDENGNIMYSNNKPHGVEAEMIEVQQTNEIKTNTEAQQLFEQSIQQELESRKSQQKNQDERNAARKKLKDTEKALEDAKAIQAGDMHSLPGGGVRYTDQYRNRIQAAEEAVKKAQEDYNKTR